jgi:prevent-host-death family protein
VTKRLSAAQAKAHFADCIRQAEQGDSVIVTRHGRPVAAIVAATNLKELQRLQAAGPGAGLASLAGGWAGSEELVRTVARSKRSRPRRLPPLGR